MTEPARDQHTWELWRQDDNGNRFLIDRFASAEAAEAEQRRFEALGHKQTYWVQRSDTEAARPGRVNPRLGRP